MIDLKPWTFLAFMTLLNVINMADRALMMAVAPSIIADLELTTFQFTVLSGFVFSLFYAVCGLFMGTLADRFHRPRLIAIGLTLWSGLTALTGATRTFLEIAVARMFMGVGESTLTPAALAMMSDKFPAHQRGLSSGIYYVGAPIGGAGSFILASFLEPLVGWRGCFYIMGAVGCFFVLCLLLLKDPTRGAMDVSRVADRGQARSFRQMMGELWAALRASPALIATILGGILATMIQGAMAIDILWLGAERGFQQVQAQRFAGACFLVGGILGGLLGGGLSDLLHKHRPDGRIYFLFVAYLVLGPLMLAYRFIPGDSPWFIAAGLITGIGAMLPMGPLMAAVQDLVVPRIRATVIALLILCIMLIGVSSGAALAGLLADLFKDAGNNKPFTMSLIISSAAPFLSIPFFWYAARHYAADRARVVSET